jgi:acyl carrier protein
MTTVDDIIQLMKRQGIARGKCDSLAADVSLAEQGLDSYDRMALLFEVEQMLDIVVPSDVAVTLKTLQKIVDHVNGPSSQ